MIFFLAAHEEADDTTSMTSATPNDTQFLKTAEDLIDLVEQVSLLEMRPAQITVATEERVAIAAEIVLYCDKYKPYHRSRRALSAKSTLLRVRQLYNF